MEAQQPKQKAPVPEQLNSQIIEQRRKQLRAKLRMALRKQQGDAPEQPPSSSLKTNEQGLLRDQRPSIFEKPIKPDDSALNVKTEHSNRLIENEVKMHEFPIRPERAERPERELEPPKGKVYSITFNKKPDSQFYSKNTEKKENDTFVFKIKDFKHQGVKKEPTVYRTRDENEAKNFFDYFPEFLLRKKKKAGQLLDVKVMSLSDIVDLCYVEKLIQEEDYHSFLYNRGTYVEKMYLQKFAHNRLDDFSFSKSRFTLFDHRRLIALLLKYHADKYKDGGRPFHIQPDITNFLTQIYSIPEEEYWKKCLAIDKRYNLKWWDAILSKHGSIMPSIENSASMQIEPRSKPVHSNNENEMVDANQEEEVEEVCEMLPEFRMNQINTKEDIGVLKRSKQPGNLAEVGAPQTMPERKNKPQDEDEDDESEDSGDIEQDDMFGEDESQNVSRIQKKKKVNSKKGSVKGKNKGSDDEMNDFGFGQGDSEDFDMGGQSVSRSKGMSKSMTRKADKSVKTGKNKKAPKVSTAKAKDDQFFSSLDEFSEDQKPPRKKKQMEAESDLDLDEVDLEGNSSEMLLEEQKKAKKKK